MIIDCHVHLDSSELITSIDKIINESIFLGIEKLINVSVSVKNFSKIRELANKYNLIFSAYGIHPQETFNFSSSFINEIERYVYNDKKCVAIGEIGLDFKLDFPDRKTQINAFIAQLEVASSLKKPVIIHCRRAFYKVYQILKKYFSSGIGGIMHAYSGSFEMAKKFIDLGFLISIAGSITYPNAKKPINLLEKLSLKDIVVETDAPYLTPYPYKGKVNKPSYIVETIKKISYIKQVDIEVLKEQIYLNSNMLFNFS